jgi:IS5 family transposase
MKQLSFASLNYAHKKVTTKREKFLNEMEQAVPWKRLLALIEPCYPKAGKGRSPNPMETMLRIYFLQQWYALSDPGAEEALYDMESMRRFARLDLSSDSIPDESSILNFRRLIETHNLSLAIFNDINDYLVDQGIRISKGSMVDATIITAPTSTQNQMKQRDPEMHSTRKNNQYFFGMKIHIGTDVNSNAIHSATVTAANVADIDEMPKLLREEDTVIFGDAGYNSDAYKRGARSLDITWKVNDKRKPKHTKKKRVNLSPSQKKRNRKNSSMRARIEHCFWILKCQFGYKKVRYKGLQKNRVQVFSLLGLANLYRFRAQLIG